MMRFCCEVVDVRDFRQECLGLATAQRFASWLKLFSSLLTRLMFGDKGISASRIIFRFVVYPLRWPALLRRSSHMSIACIQDGQRRTNLVTSEPTGGSPKSVLFEHWDY